MELPEIGLSLDEEWRSLLVAVTGALVLVFTAWMLRPSHETAVKFTVSPPEIGDDFVDDKVVDEPFEGFIYNYCPADGKPLSLPILPNDQKDIDNAIENAKKAQAGWAQTSFTQRRRLLKTLLQYVLDNQEEIVRVCCLDSGKTKIDASFGEILVTVEKLQWTITHGEKALKPSRRPTNLLMCYKKNTVIYEPLGVVGACVSWNYPFHNFISPVISALFSGNAIVVKPSEQTAWSSLYFLKIIRGALQACGFSPQLVQCIICWPISAGGFTMHPGLSQLTFIGSREVAFHVAASAARSLTPVTVELGGKDPAIVLDDPKTVRNLDKITNILMRGVFQSSGQNCVGIERVIALPGAYEKIIDLVLPKIKALKVGYPLPQAGDKSSSDAAPFQTPDLGPLMSSKALGALELLAKEADSAGATIHHGGHYYDHPDYPGGSYFTPTLISNVNPDMTIAQQELFAPVFLLMRADSVSHAIALANSTPYALGASVFGSRKAETDRCVREINAGMVSVNDFAAYYAVSMPFGGSKESGYGRFGGDEGLRSLCNIKAVCEDATWARWLGIATQIPAPLAYPIRDGEAGWEMCRGVVGLGYGIGVRAKMRGLVQLIKAAASAGKGLRTE